MQHYVQIAVLLVKSKSHMLLIYRYIDTMYINMVRKNATLDENSALCRLRDAFKLRDRIRYKIQYYNVTQHNVV